MIDNFQFKEKYSVSDLIDIVEILRSPEGCPWDREQDHKSIRRDFLEECYDVEHTLSLDTAIDDLAAICQRNERVAI